MAKRLFTLQERALKATNRKSMPKPKKRKKTAVRKAASVLGATVSALFAIAAHYERQRQIEESRERFLQSLRDYRAYRAYGP